MVLNGSLRHALRPPAPQVALANLVACAPAGGYGPGMCVMFLLDGSGSVTEGAPPPFPLF